jgi:hypothetical protein
MKQATKQTKPSKAKKRPSYGDLTIDDVRKTFQLTIARTVLFEKVAPLAPSQWLGEMLKEGFNVSVISEKARSEFIVAPILLYIREVHHRQISIYSGVRFDVDPDNGLRGVCDFILSHGMMLPTVQSPVLVLVEAKKNDIEEGLGQCAAEMVAAQIFNEREGNPIPAVYGCVTNGESWQFLRLTGKLLEIDQQRYFLAKLEEVLGILSRIVKSSVSGKKK